MYEGIWIVVQKIWKSKMSSVEYTATTKSALQALVKIETGRTGSRTVAHENVARAIGASSSWIRKYIAYDNRVAEPRYAVFKNIASYYEKICARVEQEQQIERDRLAALRVELDAFDKSFNRLVERPISQEASREAASETAEG